MTDVNNEKTIVPVPSITPPAPVKQAKKDPFTLRTSIFLILLTIIVSVGGWFVVGKVFIWTDINDQRVIEQLDYYKQEVMSEPNSAKLRVELGYTYYVAGKNPEAIKELKQALVIDSKLYDAYLNLGLVYLDENRSNEALENLSKAVKISPRDYKGHLQLGIAYRNLKMFDDSLQSLDTANKLMPTNAAIIYEIGVLAEAQGEKEGAIEIYKEVLSYDPLFKQAIEALERLEKK